MLGISAVLYGGEREHGRSYDQERSKGRMTKPVSVQNVKHSMYTMGVMHHDGSRPE
jgi:hypothetical protein